MGLALCVVMPGVRRTASFPLAYARASTPFLCLSKTWMAGSSPAMTEEGVVIYHSAHAIPGLPAAEQPAEGSALNPQTVRALHRDHALVIPAAVGIVNQADPFRI